MALNLDALTKDAQSCYNVDRTMTRMAERMIAEFQREVGLTEIQARRSTFIVLAHAKGWNNAQIGRYLGVTRYRIGQQIERIGENAETKRMPNVRKVLAKAATAPKAKLNGAAQVTFTREDWDNRAFAHGMLEQVGG